VPSRNDPWPRCLTVTAAAGMLLLAVSLSMAAPAGVAAQQPEQADIDRALANVKADPNLATLRKVAMLRWKTPAQPTPARSGWLKWIVGLFRWLDQTSRLLIWVVAALILALLVVSLGRLLRARDCYVAPGYDTFVAPSHVSDLDIRPESLPADIGAASRTLWDRGDHRAALALLYRGMLSRLVHVHSVPIRDSSTEGDCLALTEALLAGERAGYTSRLVRVWQRTVYGGEDIQTATVHDLCDGFSLMLDVASPGPAGGAAS
jgi:hypothetical protein